MFIEAANRYYPLDRVPAFWTWIEEEGADGRLRTITMVQEEVESPEEVVEWLAEREEDDFFIDISDAEIQVVYRDLAGWLVSQDFGPERVAKFLDGADLWIIAAAVVHDATVVTQEQPITGPTKKIKIPNVCQAHNVACMNTFQMMGGARRPPLVVEEEPVRQPGREPIIRPERSPGNKLLRLHPSRAAVATPDLHHHVPGVAGVGVALSAAGGDDVRSEEQQATRHPAAIRSDELSGLRRRRNHPS